MRRRETLAAVRARDDVLVLHTMLWLDESEKIKHSPVERCIAGCGHTLPTEMVL